MRLPFTGTLPLVLALGAVQAQDATARKAAPVEPIPAILDAFRDHHVVALGDDHGNEQLHAFRLALLRHPRFTGTVDDIVVEFGSARYQDIIDRYVQGQDVSRGALRDVWQNTTQPEYEWDLPIYEEFFRAVRAVNAGLPGSKKIRVLLGDPPIDWAAVSTKSQLDAWVAQRDRHAVAIIQREVLSKGRRALVIYGSAHVSRAGDGTINSRPSGIVTTLEQDRNQRVFTVTPATHLDLASRFAPAAGWPVPSLVMLKGTDLGRLPANPQEPAVPIEASFDALLYLGPLASMTKATLARDLCRDTSYMEMRLARLSLLGATPAAARLKDYCAGSSGTEIADRDPQLTELVRTVIREAAAGTVDTAKFSPESRDRVVPQLRNIGSRFLAVFGPLESLTLVGDSNEGGTRVRRYRAVFANGQGKSRWTVTFASNGTIVAIDARPE